MTVINFDEIIGKGNSYITDNIFCTKHPTNCLITGKTNNGETNILINLIAQNCIYMIRFTFLQIIQMMINIFGLKINLKMMFTFVLMKLILMKLIKIKLIWLYLMISFFQIRKYQHFLH